jgi:hypothetical protein
MPLARFVNGHAIINGDVGTHEQNQHQIIARETIQEVLPTNSAVIPYSALDGAELDFESIEVVDVTQDRTVTVKYEERDVHRIPAHLIGKRNGWGVNSSWDVSNVKPDVDGFFRATEQRHMLGECLFNASYTRDGVEGSGQFLSAFDYQEARPLYFLCQLPETVSTVGEAFEVLKPVPVLKADTLGETYMRQGDLFAVQAPFVTEELMDMGATFHTIAGHSARTLRFDNVQLLDTVLDIVKSMDYKSFTESGSLVPELQLQDTNHAATIVATLPDGRQFCQGWMVHRPEGRAADHADRFIGSDGWYEAHRNTVPFTTGAAHAWNAAGLVD